MKFFINPHRKQDIFVRFLYHLVEFLHSKPLSVDYIVYYMRVVVVGSLDFISIGGLQTGLADLIW